MNQQEQEIIEKFREIKRKQYIATVPIIIVVLVLIISSDNPNFEIFGLSSSVLITISVVGVAIGLIFSFINWRCPNCNFYLGKRANPKFCGSCGAKLQD